MLYIQVCKRKKFGGTSLSLSTDLSQACFSFVTWLHELKIVFRNSVIINNPGYIQTRIELRYR